MKKIIALLSITLTILSCKDSVKYDPYFQNENGISFENKYEFDKVTEISFPLDSNSGFWHYSSAFNKSSVDNEYYYSFLNEYDNSIIYYSLKDKKTKKVKLIEEGENGIGALSDVSTHLFMNPNSFYVYNSSSGLLFNLDSLGVINSKFEIANYKTSEDVPFPEPSTRNPFIINEDIVYFSCAVEIPKKNYSDYGMVLKFNLKNQERDYIFPFPDIYNKAFWGASFKYLTNLSHNLSENVFILNYPVSPFIYKASIDGVLIDSSYVGSKFFDIVEPMHFDMEYAINTNSRNWKAEDEFSLSNSDFAKVMYDSKKRLYYRMTFIRPSIDQVKLGKTLTDFSIIILDEKFKKLGEQKFSSQIYSNSMIFITDFGLLIARRDLYNENENEITFSVFNTKLIDQ